MKRHYFGTDGVRGKVGQAPITPDFILRLGYAAGKVLAGGQKKGRPTVLIGKDTRISGYMLEAALESGLSAAGVDVMLAGPMPTPAIAYLTRALRLAAGIVISASHNPYYDNGIKFFCASGNKLPDVIEAEIEALVQKPLACVSSDELGKASRLDDAAGRYIEFCKSTFPNHYDLHGLKLVLDCAHGAAYHIAPCVFHELGAQVIAVGVHPDGFNINRDCGAMVPEKLAEMVVEYQADLGIALDGDGDRVQMVDAQGRIYTGDELLYLLAKDRLQQNRIKGVVGTVMTNKAVEIALEKIGIQLVRTPVGDRYILEQLHQHGWQLGGESSGHIVCLDQHSTGDGIIAALQVLAALKRSESSLVQIAEDVKLLPQFMVNIELMQALTESSDQLLQKKKQEIEQELGDSGRVLIRASGTEAVLRIMVEAQTLVQAQLYANRLAEIVRALSLKRSF